MGIRIHPAKKYIIEWADGRFNNESENLNRFILKLCPDAVFNNEDPVYADEIEVGKMDLCAAVTRLIDDKDGECSAIFKDCHPLFKEEYSLKDIAKEFVRWIQYSDPNNDLVKLAWY